MTLSVGAVAHIDVVLGNNHYVHQRPHAKQSISHVRWRTDSGIAQWHSFALLYKGAKMENIEILGIVGSLRKDSYNRFALQAAQELVPEGAILNLIELQGIPVFNQDAEMTPPDSVLEFRRRIQAADAILFATPEYNYSLPGALKNAIDWASRPYGESVWLGKPAAVMGASIGDLGTSRTQYHL